MSSRLSTLPDPLEPQVAFHDWLRDALASLARWARRDDERDGFLARSVDHADLERRLRVQERGMPSPLFW